MKGFFAIFSLVLCVIGISLYRNQSDSAMSKQGYAAIDHKNDNIKKPKIATKNDTTSANEKECTCCRSTLESIKRKRKELELWAREMINTHGYEEGMRRVAEKSPKLATRIQNILERERN